MLAAAFIISMLCMTGCVTSGIMKSPDLTKLAYNENGVLLYDGKTVEGIKLKLPWYKEMWPDNGAEWSFSLMSLGVGIGVGGAMSGGDSSSAVVEETQEETTTTSSGGGGGSDPPAPAAPAPPAGGGGGDDESPW